MKVKIYYAEIAPELESTELDLNSVKVKGECIIGRSPECGLVLDGADLSRQHAKFFSRDGNYYFFDLGSRNGSLFNGEIAQADREYLLSPGDSIRIGDFILSIEQEAEMAATVFKVIDPSFFKSDRSQVEATSQPEALVSSSPGTDESTERAMPSPIIIVDNSIAKDISDRVVEQPSPAVVIGDKVKEENVPDRVTEEHPEFALTIDRSSEENILDRVPQEYLLPTLDNDEWDEKEDITDNLALEVPPSLALDVEQDREDTPEPEDWEQPSLELTSDEEDRKDLPDVEDRQQLSLGLTSDRVEADVIANVETTEQPALDLIANELDEEDTSGTETQTQSSLGLAIDRSDEDVTPEIESEQQQSLSPVRDRLDEEDTHSNAENEDLSRHELARDNVEELDEIESEDLASSIDTDELEEEDIAESEIHEQPLPALPTNELDEGTTPTSEIAEQPSLVPAAVAASAVIASGVAIDSNKIGSQLLKTKQIVLIAHDTKIADLTDIVARHQEFFAKCLTVTWSSIADRLKQETGIAVSKEISSGASGGYQTIAGLVNSGDILAVIFLKDFFAQSQTGQANEEALLRLCNINEIMLATNIATADAIVNYLQS